MGMIRFPSFLAAGRHTQYAVLPYVLSDDGMRICLVSSRESRRWVIPKGWPKAGRTAQDQAQKEALEEAGLRGEIGAKPLGRYHYRKRLHYFFSVICRVKVYPLRVETQMLSWEEQDWRELKWLPPSEAAALVEEPELAAIISSFAEKQANKPGIK
jgi:8-oxo-dGTP pyrophosphatase MutT (NUDIX family)